MPFDFDLLALVAKIHAVRAFAKGGALESGRMTLAVFFYTASFLTVAASCVKSQIRVLDLFELRLKSIGIFLQNVLQEIFS